MSKPKHLRGTQEQLEVAAKDPTPKSRPACRDCADLAVGGICPNSGRPCQTKQPAARVPDGWKLVPVEPTPEMESAAMAYVYTDGFTRGAGPSAVYAAMLSAAPSQRVPDGVPTAVREAVAAIYFEDGADYIRALWSVVRALSPTIAKLLEDDAQAAFDMAEAMLSAAPSQQAPVQGEPVGYMNAGHVHELKQGRAPYGHVYQKADTGASVAVYTAPQQASKPMPDEQIERGYREWLDSSLEHDEFKAGARFAERHHNIGEKQ